jgi:uncharacterized protein
MTNISRLRRMGIVLIGVAAFAGGSAGARPPIDVPPLGARVNDTAGLLSSVAAAALEEKLAAYEQATTSQFVLLTIPSLKGDILESFSLRVAEAWKIGRKRVDNGVILVVVKDDRKIRIEIGYGLEASLTDAVTSRIISGMIVPHFRDGDFEGGITLGFEALMKAAEHPAARTEKPKGRGVGGWIVLILALVAGYAFAGMMIYSGLFSHGGAVMIYVFVGGGLGIAGTYLSEQGTSLGYWIFFAFLIGFPALKLILPRTAWGRDRILTSDAAAKAYRGSHPSSVHWSSGTSHSSWSSGGGGFSGGGGSFGGGGASGSW